MWVQDKPGDQGTKRQAIPNGVQELYNNGSKLILLRYECSFPGFSPCCFCHIRVLYDEQGELGYVTKLATSCVHDRWYSTIGSRYIVCTRRERGGAC